MYVELMGRIITVRRIKFKDDCQLGQFIGDRDTILLAKGMKKRLEKKVLKHEMYHAIMYYSGIGAALDQDKEEMIVTALENYAKDVERVKLIE